MTTEAEHFVRVWQTSSSVGEAAKALNITPVLASRKAFYMRKKGVALKTFRVKGGAEQYAKLAELAASLT